jgi:hypothetical protein
MDFKEGDVVEFACGSGRVREMVPINIKMALEVCAEHGCTRFTICEVQHIASEEGRRMADHHNLVIIKDSQGRIVLNEDGWAKRFSAAHFVLVDE